MDELLEPDRSEADVPSARGQAPAFPAAGGSLIHTTSLCGDIVFRPLLARQSLAAKIPFQTRRERALIRIRSVSGTPNSYFGFHIEPGSLVATRHAIT